MARKVKLSFIENKTKRKTTFRKRKKGILKSLEQLTTLCGIEAVAVINSPYDPTPVTWPSMEAVQEVASRIPELPYNANKNTDHETYLEQMISKEKDKGMKLWEQNQESQIRQCMFNCMEHGKINEHQFGDVRDLQELKHYMSYYTRQLNYRIEHLTNNGESSSSSIPHLPTGAEDVVAPLVASDAATPGVVAPLVASDAAALDVVAPLVASDATAEMAFDLNQYPEQEKSFMDLSVKQSQHMGNVGEHASTLGVDGNYPTTTNR